MNASMPFLAQEYIEAEPFYSKLLHLYRMRTVSGSDDPAHAGTLPTSKTLTRQLSAKSAATSVLRRQASGVRG